MNQNTIELAIQALEAEREKINAAIADLRGGTRGRTTSRRVVPASAMGVATSPKPTAGRRGKRRGISAAGRAALAAAAKRRWAKAKAAGKSTL
jgi:hypothetical protein